MHSHPITSLSALSTALLLTSLTTTTTACTTFDAEPPPPPAAPGAGADNPAGAGAGAEGPKAPPVSGSPDNSELTEAFGVFVSPQGRDDAPGDRTRPLGTINAGIASGKRLGKRVYVCSGTFHESIAVADSISIIGGLDCSRSDWRHGSAPTRIEAPSSPAIRAADITAPTRLEGLEVVAPNATGASESSFGIIAQNAGALHVARSTITAGDAGRGIDGVDGVQLVNVGTINGQPFKPEAECIDGATCTAAPFSVWLKPKGGLGGTSICAGEGGHDGEAGGDGGSGGLHEVHQNVHFRWRYFQDKVTNGPELGVVRLGRSGAPGTDGANARALGAFSADGYAPANGSAGTNGEPGRGGYGGRGVEPARDPNLTYTVGIWRGNSGAGGGAGGCPGLAGTAGTGGGASVAALLIGSPVTFEHVTLVAGRGGDAGRGTLGSAPTAGGQPGLVAADVDPMVAGAPGGNGGVAGISGNGAPGPSIAIVHLGAAPKLVDASRLTPGEGGAPIEAQSIIDAIGNARSIPATPAGLAKDIHAL